MPPLAPPASHPPRPHRLPRPGAAVESQPCAPQVAYDRAFWLTYASNLLFVTGVTLLFRYADFVTLLGGTEFHLGWIVGVGMIGSLFMRLALGSCIDRYGTKVVWLGSTLLFSISCFAHLMVTNYAGIAIYALRILYCCALAGVAGASITFVSKRGPTKRIAEMVGMLGTSGFVGIIVGALLGDLLMNSVTVGREQIQQMFVVAAVVVLASLPFAWFATRSEVQPTRSPDSSLYSLLLRHHPGPVLALSVVMGLGYGLPTVFLRTYAADLGIPRIGAFFTIYAIAAVVTRILTRRWPERYGNRPIILLGTAVMVVSMLLFLLVHTEWQLALPAIGFGCYHAILFPAVMAAGSETFPARHRGLATVLVLAASDLGLLVGSPTAGAVLRYSETAGLPPYPTMFLTMAGLMAIVGAWYAIVTRAADVKKAP